MECGEFDKRNKTYHSVFSKELYFQRLFFGDLLEPHDERGEGKVIFDVGAHGGESARFFNDILPSAKVYSFEPQPKMAESIREMGLANNEVVECALSDFSGSENFYVQDITHLSSLHKVNKNSEESLGYHLTETHEVVTVDVMTGNQFIAQRNIPTIDLLKIDVQANEVATLKGFSEYISNVKTVLVEVSFYDFYENKSSIQKIEAQLPGFQLYDIYEVSKNPKTLGTDWATIVYKNTGFVGG